MFRQLIFAAVLTAATVTVATPVAEARPPAAHGYGDHNRGRNNHRYEVFVRHGQHWDSHGTFHARADAQRAAWRLRQQGFQVKIDDC